MSTFQLNKYDNWMKQNMTSIVNPKYVKEVKNPSLFKYKHRTTRKTEKNAGLS